MLSQYYLRGYGRRKPPQGARIDWTHPLARELVACYLLQEGDRVVDYTQFGCDGTNFGTTPTPGKFGMGRNFASASKQYILIGKPAKLNLPGDVSLVAWINFTTTGTCYWLGSHDTTQQIAIRSSAGKSDVAWGIRPAVGTIVCAAGTWHQIGVTRKGATGAWTGAVYVDGSLDISGTTATDPPVQQTFAIGRVGSLDSLYLNGKIDHALVYNRALSAAEFAWLYNEPFAMFQRPRIFYASLPTFSRDIFSARVANAVLSTVATIRGMLGQAEAGDRPVHKGEVGDQSIHSGKAGNR